MLNVFLVQLRQTTLVGGIVRCFRSGRKHKKGYKNSGVLHLLLCEVASPKSFVDYLMGGLQLMCTFAIDFTVRTVSAALASHVYRLFIER